MSVSYVNTLMLILTISTVKRVHWLRARAQKQRWHEEVILVTYEMQWTVRYFLNKSDMWKKGADCHTISPGGKAYARRQSTFWAGLTDVADRVFKNTTMQYRSPIDIM